MKYIKRNDIFAFLIGFVLTYTLCVLIPWMVTGNGPNITDIIIITLGSTINGLISAIFNLIHQDYNK